VPSDPIADIYERTLLSEVPRIAPGDPQLSALARRLPGDRQAAIVDAGCGNGRYALGLARNGYTNVLGVDLFDRLETQGLFRYDTADVAHLPLPDESVDLVYSMSVVHYLPNPEDGFREFGRVLKPGGTVVLSAHTRYSPFTWVRAVARACGRAKHLRGLKFWSAGQYVRMLRSAGLEVLDVDGFYLLFVPMVLRHGLRILLGGRATTAAPDLEAARNARRSWRWLRRLRSIFGYHLLIAARKPE